MVCQLSALSWKLITISSVIITYLSIGALVFEALERPNLVSNCENAKTNLKENLSNITIRGIINETKIKKLFDDVQKYSNQGMHVDVNILSNGNISYEVTCPSTWKFVESFFFCGTVITTIGYSVFKS